jgi:hypothetical protein
VAGESLRGIHGNQTRHRQGSTRKSPVNEHTAAQPARSSSTPPSCMVSPTTLSGYERQRYVQLLFDIINATQVPQPQGAAAAVSPQRVGSLARKAEFLFIRCPEEHRKSYLSTVAKRSMVRFHSYIAVARAESIGRERLEREQVDDAEQLHRRYVEGVVDVLECLVEEWKRACPEHKEISPPPVEAPPFAEDKQEPRNSLLSPQTTQEDKSVPSQSKHADPHGLPLQNLDHLGNATAPNGGPSKRIGIVRKSKKKEDGRPLPVDALPVELLNAAERSGSESYEQRGTSPLERGSAVPEMTSSEVRMKILELEVKDLRAIVAEQGLQIQQLQLEMRRAKAANPPR